MIELKSARTPTNGDKIRAMSDEGLFAFLHEIKKRARICQTARIDDSELCSLDWLHQPAHISRGHENIGENNT